MHARLPINTSTDFSGHSLKCHLPSLTLCRQPPPPFFFQLAALVTSEQPAPWTISARRTCLLSSKQWSSSKQRVQSHETNKCFANLDQIEGEFIEMEIEDTKKISSSKLFSMTGGKGQYSYVNNSSFQKMGLDVAKRLMQEEITEKLDIDRNMLSPPNVFRISDLGCAAGPNTFFLVQDIIEAVKSKYESEEIEFQVFFNDHSANDFNTLFRTLPVGKNYFANGVPGSFYERLFPKASLHLVHSSYAIPWLSKVPEKVQDKSSPAWNKGRILYENCKEVELVYAAQFANDFNTFLKARAEEMVPGGLMVLLFPSVQTEANPPKCIMVTIFELLGSSLMDMAKTGLVDEAKVDSFNLHLYFPSAEEVKTIVERNGSFTIEKMQQLDRLMPVIEKLALVIRAASEEIVRDHFGAEIIDKLYNRFTEKLVQSGLFSDSSFVPNLDLFTFLKRNGE